ncbi:MAG: hypothetical protein ABI388_03540, partial [Bacteroidia bacterium]
MKLYRTRLAFLLAAYLLSLFIFTDARILFFLFNKSKFVGVTNADFIQALFYGLRFDTITATIINALFILLVAFPISFFQHKTFRVFLKVVFVTTNSIAFAFNMIDTAYFPY